MASISSDITSIRQVKIDGLDRSVLYAPESSGLPNWNEHGLDLTLFVACYNEEENIIATLEEVASAMSGLNLSWEVIVIDDASTDKSVALVKEYMCRFPAQPIILVVREINQGLAQNFIEAAFLGRGKYFRLINGDNVENNSQISSILGHIGEADILIPYHEQVPDRSLFRKFLSKTFTAIVNLLSGYRIRYYNACSVHLRHDVMRWHVNCTGFDYQANLITRLLSQGRTYVEIPAVGSERSFGSSKALTLKNFFSVAHFFVDLAFRRTWKWFHGK
jgi:glycosyltransferase involved in cell wall biosynthesis